MNFVLTNIVILTYLVFAAQTGSVIHVSKTTTFSISLQSNKKLSLEDWARYDGNIPRLEEFTACHWDKLSYFSTHVSTIWNYCYTKTNNSSLWCIQIEYAPLIETAYRHMLLVAYFGSDQISAKIIPFQHRAWNYICWTYSTVTKENELFFNGKLLVRKKYSQLPVVEGNGNVYASEFVIGQEQDVVGGGYTVSQTYSGEIAELNIWDYVLEQDMIKNVAECNNRVSGNIVSWETEKWNVNQGVIHNQLDEKIFCRHNKQLVIFPTRQPLHISKIICAAHGGKIATPMSMEENKNIKDLVEKHTDCVSSDKTHHKNWGTLAWIGTKRVNGVWYDVSQDDLMKKLDYSSWSVDPNYGDTSVDCSYIKSDGSWMYHPENNGTCPNLDMCTVCTILNTPVFTFKGVCLASLVDWNYYMGIDNETREITHYDGYKRGILDFTDNTWKTTGIGFNFTLTKGHKMIYPVGRLSWYKFDANCKMDHHTDIRSLTLSRCEFGQEFTCKSGLCIDIQKRCNMVQDCKDNSDEENCHLIEVPNTYKKVQLPKTRKGSNETMPLHIYLRIESINLIDTTEMIMELTIEISVKWSDGRLKFKNLPSNSESLIPTTILDEIWHPFDKIVHDNAVIGKIYNYKNDKRASVIAVSSPMPLDVKDPFEDQLFDSYETMLEMNKTFRVPYICTFSLQKFPFDTQSCNFSMHIPLERDSKLTFIKTGKGIFYEGPEIIHQFKIGEITSSVGMDGRKIWLEYNINMKRLYNNQIINTFFPTCLMWILAYSTLFINLDNFNNRFMGAVTSLLVLSSLLGSINNTLPKTSYFKYIDIWFLWYITNILLIIISHIIMDNVPNTSEDNSSSSDNIQTSQNYMGKRTSINRISIKMFPVFTVCFNIIYLYNSMKKGIVA